ncbi:MAG: GIY-YIG nuclease family protein [Flavonifractor plautii]
MSWWVYILRCGDGTLYTGTAADVERRLAAHRRGRGAKYTRSRGPLAVVYREECPDRGAALRREAAIKKYRRAEKEALITDYAERRSRMKKAAFIGTGNMGAPLIQAACRAVGAEQVVVANRTRAKAEALAAELGRAVAEDNRGGRQAEYVFLCVKPQMMEECSPSWSPPWGMGRRWCPAPPV